MRRSALVLLGAVLVLIGAGACGGNVVADGLPGPIQITTGTGGSISGTSASTGSGGAMCLTCAARLPQIFMGVTQTIPTCPGAASMAEQAFLSCACGGTCASVCATNICVTSTLTPSCQDCTQGGCANELAACAGN